MHPLQFPVYSQNDAAEFYDGAVNALAEYTHGTLGKDVKNLLEGKTRRLKHCHNCRKCFPLEPESFFKLELLVPAPILHHSPIIEWPKKPSWALLEYPKKIQLETSPPILQYGPMTVGPYIFAPILIVDPLQI